MCKFSSRGIPILSMVEKLAGLTYCIENGAYEDAAGHLCDLLEHCRKNIKPDSGKPFASLQEMVKYYGGHPTSIEG